MSILGDLREFLAGDKAPTSSSPAAADAPAESTEELTPPFEGYDQLDAREVMDQLPKHSQVELDAVESYERAHKAREQVLNKLRYMRGNEPIAGYDALAADEITSALATSDVATIRKIRTYERKFANRPDVLIEVESQFHARQATEPARVIPEFSAVPASAHNRDAKPDAE